MKRSAALAVPAAGRFLWLRRELVGAVGGCLYHETPVLVQFGDDPMVWFNRDEFGHALLNARMLTTTGNEQERIRIEDNDFSVRGTPVDFECPPSGRLLRVRYANGDYMRVAFREVHTRDAAARAFPHIHGGLEWLTAEWPLTFVTISMRAGGTNVRFGPTMTMLPGNNSIRGAVMSHCGAGLRWG